MKDWTAAISLILLLPTVILSQTSSDNGQMMAIAKRMIELEDNGRIRLSNKEVRVAYVRGDTTTLLRTIGVDMVSEMERIASRGPQNENEGEYLSRMAASVGSVSTNDRAVQALLHASTWVSSARTGLERIGRPALPALFAVARIDSSAFRRRTAFGAIQGIIVDELKKDDKEGKDGRRRELKQYVPILDSLARESRVPREKEKAISILNLLK